MSPRPARRDAVRPGETRQATALFGLEPDGEMLGVVLEGRLQDVAHSGLEISFAWFCEFPSTGQLGRAVCEIGENMGMDASVVPQLKTPATRAAKVAQDGLLPAAHVGPVEKQVGRGGARVESEVFGVQREVRGRLEAAEQASAPSFAIIEGAASGGAAVVCKKIWGVLWVPGKVGGGGGERVGRDLEHGAGVADGVPVVRHEARHELPRRRRC